MNKTSSLEQRAKTGDLNAVLIMSQYMFDKIAKFLEIKSINLKLKQPEIAKEMKKSSSTLQRYKREINMLSPYRIPSSTTHTKKQKISSSTKHDLKLTSKDLKITSKVQNYKAVSKKVKSKNNLGCGDPNDDVPINGRDLIEQAFSSQKLSEFEEIIKEDSKVQNETTQTFEEYNKESYSVPPRMGENALLQNKGFEQIINIMGSTIEDMEIEVEQKDIKIKFLENKRGLPDCKVLEMNKLGFKKVSFKKR